MLNLIKTTCYANGKFFESKTRTEKERPIHQNHISMNATKLNALNLREKFNNVTNNEIVAISISMTENRKGTRLPSTFIIHEFIRHPHTPSTQVSSSQLKMFKQTPKWCEIPYFFVVFNE